jgi:hypothetical protein
VAFLSSDYSDIFLLNKSTGVVVSLNILSTTSTSLVSFNNITVMESGQIIVNDWNGNPNVLIVFDNALSGFSVINVNSMGLVAGTSSSVGIISPTRIFLEGYNGTSTIHRIIDISTSTIISQNDLPGGGITEKQWINGTSLVSYLTDGTIGAHYTHADLTYFTTFNNGAALVALSDMVYYDLIFPI